MGDRRQQRDYRPWWRPGRDLSKLQPACDRQCELPLRTVAEVGTTPGTDLDPLAPAGSLVSSVGVEREGFRNGRLAITATMLYVDPIDPTITESWGGIYMSTGVIDLIFRDGFD